MTTPSDTAPVQANGDGKGQHAFTAPQDPTARPPGHRPWYRRWALLIVVVVGVVAASVITDLPTTQTLQDKVNTAAGVVKEIATGVHACAYATAESFTIYGRYTKGTFPASARSLVPKYLNDDRQACTLGSQTIFGMSTITVPNSPTGAQLTGVIKYVLEWSTSDAVGAIIDIQTLVHNPTDAKVLSDLSTRERRLASDRAAAERDLRLAERDLHGSQLPSLGLPTLPAPASTAS
ncbi:MAG TPA: hypothetical protein VKR78_07015 [Acidimicrobiales bacterium]|nr:hypothetical protein [Acidimicrobiales bacterium]